MIFNKSNQLHVYPLLELTVQSELTLYNLNDYDVIHTNQHMFRHSEETDWNGISNRKQSTFKHLVAI